MAEPARSLADVRADIDAVDGAIVDLLGRRRRLVLEAAAAKAQTGAAMFDPAREAALIAALEHRATSHQLQAGLLTDLYTRILAWSRQLRPPP